MKTDYLKYGKVRLRPLEPEDINLLYEWENNTEIWEVSNTKTPFSKQVLTQYIMDSAYDIYSTKQLRLIIEGVDQNAVGAIDLFDFDPYHQRAGIGILVHKNEDRRQGFASDALFAISNYSLNVLGLYQLYANISEDNETSISLFEKCGFMITAKKTGWLKTPAGWKNELILQKFL
ncbi:MAG: GNAT family N-acetyltransferase [Prolixibacteraceae bacterium]|nr:GNAT family N-acetyltransferase [Prolixibacteraceae bacterium]